MALQTVEGNITICGKISIIDHPNFIPDVRPGGVTVLVIGQSEYTKEKRCLRLAVKRKPLLLAGYLKRPLIPYLPNHPPEVHPFKCTIPSNLFKYSRSHDCTSLPVLIDCPALVRLP